MQNDIDIFNGIGSKMKAIREAICDGERMKQMKKYLDFGISTEQAGSVFNLGLASQKEGFGGRTVVYDMYSIKI